MSAAYSRLCCPSTNPSVLLTGRPQPRDINEISRLPRPLPSLHLPSDNLCCHPPTPPLVRSTPLPRLRWLIQARLDPALEHERNARSYTHTHTHTEAHAHSFKMPQLCALYCTRAATHTRARLRVQARGGKQLARISWNERHVDTFEG